MEKLISIWKGKRNSLINLSIWIKLFNSIILKIASRAWFTLRIYVFYRFFNYFFNALYKNSENTKNWQKKKLVGEMNSQIFCIWGKKNVENLLKNSVFINFISGRAEQFIPYPQLPLICIFAERFFSYFIILSIY